MSELKGGKGDYAGTCTTLHAKHADAYAVRILKLGLDQRPTYKGTIQYSISEVATPVEDTTAAVAWPDGVAAYDHYEVAHLALVPKGRCAMNEDFAAQNQGYPYEDGAISVPARDNPEGAIAFFNLSSGEYDLCLVKSGSFPDGLASINVCANISWEDVNVAPKLEVRGGKHYYGIGEPVELTLTPTDANNDEVTVKLLEGADGYQLTPSLDGYQKPYYRFRWTPQTSTSQQYALKFQAWDGKLATLKTVTFGVARCVCGDLGCHLEGGGCNEHGCWVKGGGCAEACTSALCSTKVSRCWDDPIFKDTCLLGIDVGCRESITCSPQ